MNYRYAAAVNIGAIAMGIVLVLIDLATGRTTPASLGVTFVLIGVLTAPIVHVLRWQSDRITALEKRIGATAAENGIGGHAGTPQVPPSA